MFPEIVWTPGGVGVAAISAFAVVIGAILVFTRGSKDSKQALDKRIDDRVTAQLTIAFETIDRQAEQLTASYRVFRAMAKQAESKGVTFDVDPNDAKILGDILAPIWQHREIESAHERKS